MEDNTNNTEKVVRVVASSATTRHHRLRGQIHQRFGKAGFVAPSNRVWVRTWDDVWRVLDVEPQEPPCGGKIHGWLLPQQECVVARGRRNDTFWICPV